MNYIGLTVVIFIIIFLHIILRRYENFEQQSKEIIQILKGNKNNKKMNYEKINLKKVEDKEGIDLETDFSLLKKDLLKYVDESRSIFNIENYNSSNLVKDK